MIVGRLLALKPRQLSSVSVKKPIARHLSFIQTMQHQEDLWGFWYVLNLLESDTSTWTDIVLTCEQKE